MIVPRVDRSVLTGPAARYTAAVLGFIALGIMTKEFVAFTWGPLYFVLVLEVIPRAYRRIRYPDAPPPPLGPAPAPEP